MGSEIGFAETLGPRLDIPTGLAKLYENIEDLNIDLDGEFSNFEIFEVTDVTDTENPMSIRSGTYPNLDSIEKGTVSSGGDWNDSSLLPIPVDGIPILIVLAVLAVIVIVAHFRKTSYKVGDHEGLK